MKDLNKPDKDTADLMIEIVEALDYMVTIPAKDLTMRQQQLELAMSREQIKHLLHEVANYEIYLLERLKHSETERFSKW